MDTIFIITAKVWAFSYIPPPWEERLNSTSLSKWKTGLLHLDVAYRNSLLKRITHLLQGVNEASLDLCIKIQPAENLL